MFPSDWSTQTGLRRNKRRAPDEPPPVHSPPATPLLGSEPPPSASAPLEDLRLPSLILRNVNTASRAPATPAELNLDAILSRVPYREILENLFGREHYPHPDVPVVTRAYEEAFLREPMPNTGERSCVAGELCECMFIDPCMPFVGVEFTLPSEAVTRPDTPQFCVLCCRKVTQKLFYDVLFTGKEVHGVIQRYGNLCSVQGTPPPPANGTLRVRPSRPQMEPSGYAPAARKCPLEGRHAVLHCVHHVQQRVQMRVEHRQHLLVRTPKSLERLSRPLVLCFRRASPLHLVRVQSQHRPLAGAL